MATIRITTKFFPLAFLLFFFPARVVLDGAEERKLGWFKTTDISVTPGTHRLHLYFPYMLPSKAGKADVEVTVEEGQTVQVNYKAPWLVFMRGRVKIAT
jgi:major membrane immunogen (membrane-anchored lipoprotein)